MARLRRAVERGRLSALWSNGSPSLRQTGAARRPTWFLWPGSAGTDRRAGERPRGVAASSVGAGCAGPREPLPARQLRATRHAADDPASRLGTSAPELRRGRQADGPRLSTRRRDSGRARQFPQRKPSPRSPMTRTAARGTMCRMAVGVTVALRATKPRTPLGGRRRRTGGLRASQRKRPHPRAPQRHAPECRGRQHPLGPMPIPWLSRSLASLLSFSLRNPAPCLWTPRPSFRVLSGTSPAEPSQPGTALSSFEILHR